MCEKVDAKEKREKECVGRYIECYRRERETERVTVKREKDEVWNRMR